MRPGGGADYERAVDLRERIKHADAVQCEEYARRAQASSDGGAVAHDTE